MGKELGVVLQDKQDVGTQRAVQQEAGPPRPAPGDHLWDLDERGWGFWGEEGGLEEGLLDLIQGGAEGDNLIDNAYTKPNRLLGSG